ncbi:Flavodoxin domain protein [uncultured archaeon]|nr:Flavodoxin domain protein [uncultured archaeon]
MKAVVVYASKYGSTRGIAEFIAEKFRQTGMQAEARHTGDVQNPGDYDAFVIGSAVYMEHWLKEAKEFVTGNRDLLANRPVWLFSSGPLGTRTTDAQGRDLRTVAEPKEIAGFRDIIKPRDHRVFFGVYDSSKLGFGHRMMRILPAARNLFPEGDFRDWNDIEAWAISIARALETPQATPGSNEGAQEG